MPSQTSTPTSSLTASKQLCRSDWLKAFGKTLDALRQTGFDDGAQIVKRFIMQEQQIMDDVCIPIAGAANDADTSNEKKTKRKKPKRKKNKNR